MPAPLVVRRAETQDAGVIARLVNHAYSVEAFFVAGDRTSTDGVLELMTRGLFLVVDGEPGDDLAGCVYLTLSVPRAYFGMLSVDPLRRGSGIGRALIAAVETHARQAGCRVMDIKVVNLRSELFPFYDRLGYRIAGTEPYEHRPVLMPCHFVTMEKNL